MADCVAGTTRTVMVEFPAMVGVAPALASVIAAATHHMPRSRSAKPIPSAARDARIAIEDGPTAYRPHTTLERAPAAAMSANSAPSSRLLSNRATSAISAAPQPAMSPTMPISRGHSCRHLSTASIRPRCSSAPLWLRNAPFPTTRNYSRHSQRRHQHQRDPHPRKSVGQVPREAGRTPTSTPLGRSPGR